MEGHSGDYRIKLNILRTMAQSSSYPHRLCEIGTWPLERCSGISSARYVSPNFLLFILGFNSGHAVLNLLLYTNTRHITSFDLGEHW